MGLALGPPRLPDPDRDVPCRPGVALVAKRPHLRETERLSAGAPHNASWIAAWSAAPPWGLLGAWGRNHAGQAFSGPEAPTRPRRCRSSPGGISRISECRSRRRRSRPHPAPASDNYFVGGRSGLSAHLRAVGLHSGSGTNVARPPLVDLVGHGNHRLAADRTRLPDRKKHRHRISPAPQL